MSALFSFLGVEPFSDSWSVRGSLNAGYFAAYRELAKRPRGLIGVAFAQRYARAVARYGYDLRRPAVLGRPDPEIEALRPGTVDAGTAGYLTAP